MKKPIYLDYQSTTPIDPRVIAVITKSLQEDYGNPHSRTHSFGWKAEEIIENARNQVAEVIKADSREIFFTSGATESNNIAIKGVAKFYESQKKHIITVATEHKCVINSCRDLEQEGFRVTFLPVKNDGLIDITKLKEAICEDTALISVMAVNNEIGTIQPLAEIGKICKEKNIFFHTDAAQAFGKIPLDVEALNIDLMSISAHKIYGPKGIGALYIRRKPRVRIKPLFSGGGQERGIRSGTAPTSIIAGFGEAARIANLEMEKDYEHVKKLSHKFFSGIMEEKSIYLNGPALEKENERYIGNINLSFAGIEGESMIMAIKDLAVSSGSACTSSSLEPSYVLHSLGVAEELSHTSIRFGIGRFTTEEEIDFAINLVRSKIQKLRELSPLWEMMQEGVDLKSIEWKSH
ncbi:MAG: IscS subfamily cysteine desulfurase [Rickettsiales bacterium]|nr:IscS subfamily cysteine desulfurase [Rickettsiales bacterium]